MSLIISNESTPAQPPASSTEVFVNSSKKLSTIDDASLVRVFATLDGIETFTNKTLTGELLTAGTATVAPLTFNAGTNLTTPVAGATEYDGTSFYDTIDTTSGRAQRSDFQIFRLNADGSALGPTIADFFGATSSFPTVLNAIYLMEFFVWFTKTTAGTVTWTLTNTQTYTNIAAYYDMCPVGGIGTNGAQNGGGIDATTTAAAALPVTGTLTTATEQFARIVAVVNVGTAGNIRLRVTSSAGTVTPRRGSFYRATRLFAGNVGTFVA
ncbi:MAG: hypothetical protein E6H08_06000 [Bacteroidetes bacterium]|nr:MAG: hypothetical protein E6H08_06000 [Bacteroidota bacterium]